MLTDCPLPTPTAAAQLILQAHKGKDLKEFAERRLELENVAPECENL